MFPGHAFHLGGIGVEQPLLEISDLGFEGSQPLVDVEIEHLHHLRCAGVEAAWLCRLYLNEPITGRRRRARSTRSLWD